LYALIIFSIVLASEHKFPLPNPFESPSLCGREGVSRSAICDPQNILKKAGLTPPTKWSEVKTYCQAAKAKGTPAYGAPWATGWPTIMHSYATTATMVYAKDMLFKVREFFEQFSVSDYVTLEDGVVDFDRWIFDRELFKSNLTKSLPVNDFFSWCYQELQKDFQDIDTDKFFALCGLLFDGDLQIEFSKKAERVTLTTTTSKISLPKIKIEPALKI
jgi:hypothetical protein